VESVGLVRRHIHKPALDTVLLLPRIPVSIAVPVGNGQECMATVVADGRQTDVTKINRLQSCWLAESPLSIRSEVAQHPLSCLGGFGTVSRSLRIFAGCESSLSVERILFRSLKSQTGSMQASVGQTVRGCAAVRVLSVNCFRMPTFQTKTGRL
jgi:hypothetical protein